MSNNAFTTGERPYMSYIRYGSIRGFGSAAGNTQITKQRDNRKSCVYDGIQY